MTDGTDVDDDPVWPEVRGDVAARAGEGCRGSALLEYMLRI